MRFRRVVATRFGPFIDEEIEPADGMTVVYGQNESGKSTWHAAVYAALCGVRRGRGQPRTDDREFEERHRPWDGDSWRVGCVVHLDDRRKRTPGVLGGKAYPCRTRRSA